MYISIMLKTLLNVTLFSVVFFLNNKTALSQNNTVPQHELKMIQPPYLKVGDTVAIVAPAGILKNREVEINTAKTLLKKWGLHAVTGQHIFNQAHHFAGTDDERCEDFQNALNNPNIRAIWCARGGYGSVRILDKLDWTAFKNNPKWIIGYSDITAIHNQLHNIGVQSIHAMMCTSLQDNAATIPETIATFKAAIFGENLNYILNGSKYNKTGSVSAPLIGGNLTIMHSMLGSNTSLNTSGKIVFIEEIGEYKYHIDRMLQSLKRAGYFDTCKGVIIGDITKIKKNTTSWGVTIEQLFLDVLSDFDIPVAFNMKAGHARDNRALILGRTAILHVSKTESTLQFTP